ncbi:MAG: tRNA uridine-5-carboxymethylaminomethyl(34) synthesis GTPase MnmE [Bacteroidales bacterium]|nr:tRNA uridine-5-carboxymethylaminomethyl(34) synthesis GTPase MnmE [Bacteroidales bacterium]
MGGIGDTICAPATAASGSAICVVRVSGPDALAVTDKVVRFKTGAALSSEGYSLKFGQIPDLDEVLVAVFRAPHSYTGEDSTEISCHASPYIVSELLSRLLQAGARMAGPGEFTRRAFAAGKMDLAQAEAVADLIAADSAATHRVARQQLGGAYSAELRGLRDRLVELASLMELELDFSEEDVAFADRSQLQNLLDAALLHVGRLADSFRTGNAIRNGVPVAIVGAVNSGKSTLLNALLGTDRAIVSDEPGTTRDTVEETLLRDGVRFRFIDTAGLRETEGKIEKMGIERSLRELARAEIVLAVLDGTAPLAEVGKAYSEVLRRIPPTQTLIVLRNKVDAYDAIAPEEFPTKDMSYGILELKYPAFGTYDLDPEQFASALAAELNAAKTSGSGSGAPVSGRVEPPQVLDISARTGEGLDELRRRLVESRRGVVAPDATLVTNLRHYEALLRAQDALLRVDAGLSQALPSDLLAQDLREAIWELGSIFGEVSSDEILGQIFSKFCIGK